MRSMLYFCIAVACFGALDARARTVRRDLTLESDEEEFINEFDSFLDDSEGVASQNYWPNDAKPLEEFGIMQKSFISDMVLQTCIVSGVFLRKGETTPPTDTKRERLVTRLLELLRTKRSPNNPSGSMDWENDPFVLLEDAEAQYRNLCISLFELRRLNRKLAKNIIRVRLAMKLIAEGTVQRYTKNRSRDNAGTNKTANDPVIKPTTGGPVSTAKFNKTRST